MHITEIALYSFSELDDHVKERLTEEYGNELCFDGDPIIEGFTEDMAVYGAKDIDVQWSGFYSQGDGACFTGDFDTVKLLSSLYKYNTAYDKLINRIKDGVYSVEISVVRCGQSNHYSHENTVKACMTCENYEDLTKHCQEQLAEIENEITSWVRSECISLYDSLEAHYNERTSDSFIAEDLNELGHVYTRSGNQIAMRDTF